MKTACFAFVITLLSFACHSSKNDSRTVSGTYVRVANSELNVLYDTLTFSLVNDRVIDSYTISQRSSTHFKKKEDQGFNKNANRTITGTYIPNNHVIQTPDPGILYVFDLDAQMVTINGIVYKKIR